MVNEVYRHKCRRTQLAATDHTNEEVNNLQQLNCYFDKEFEVKSQKNIRSFAFGRMRGHVSKIHPCNGCKYNQAAFVMLSSKTTTIKTYVLMI
jgi:hypothetical protein